MKYRIVKSFWNLRFSQENRILVVVHTERGDTIRIISARKATKKERDDYESNEK